MNFPDYQFGLGFLRKWWAKTTNAPTGEPGFQAVIKKYTDAQIESFGAMARRLDGQFIFGVSKLDRIINKAISENGYNAPSRAAWNSYFLSETSEIDTVGIVKDTAVDTAKMVGKVAVFGGAAYLGIGLLIGGIALYGRVRSK